MEDLTMLELADKLLELREEKTVAEATLKDIASEISEVESQLVELMCTEECSSFVRGAKRITLQIRESLGPVVERKDELWTKMKRHGFGSLFTINSRTLSSTLKELKANNDGEIPKWLDGLITSYEQPVISVTKK